MEASGRDLILVGLALRDSKIRKKALSALLWGLFLLSAFAVATRNRLVQNALADWVMKQVSAYLQTPVSVGLVQVDFLRNFHLEDLSVTDVQGDTLLWLPSLDVALSRINWWDRQIRIRQVNARALQLSMGFHSGSEGNNYQQILDRLSVSSGGSGPAWSWYIQEIRIDGGRFRYFDLRETGLSLLQEEAYSTRLTAGRFAPEYMDFQAVKLLTGPCFSDSAGDPQFHIERLSTQERSGLFVQEFKTDLNVRPQFLRFRNSELRTPCSQVKWLMDLDYRHEYALDSVFEYMLWMGDVEEAEICTQDLAYFHEWFDHRNGKISMLASFEGPLGNLEIPGFSLNLGQGTNLNGTYYLRGLPYADSLVHRIELADSKLVPSDLEPLFPGESWVGELASWGAWVADANFDLDAQELYVQGSVNSGKGQFNGWYAYDLNSEWSEFSASLQSFDAGFALGDSRLGLLQGQLLGRFRDVPGPRMVVDVEGSLESLQLMNKDVHDIELELALTQSSAKGQWKCRDPFLTHEAWLQVEDMLDLPTWSLSANLLACDLQALGWDSLPSILSTQLEIEGKSFDIDAFEGQVLVRNLDWLHNGSALHVNRQKLSRPRALAWNLEGDAIQGKIRGRFQPSQSQALIQAWLHDAVPQRFAAPIHSPSDSFEASFAVLQTDWLEHFVFPGAQMDPFEWSLSVRPGNQFALKTGAIHLEWAGFQMEGVQVEAQRSATESWTLSLASKYMRVGRTEYDDWGLQMTAQDQVWRTHAWVHDLKNRYAVNAHLRTRVTPEFISTRVDSSHLRLYDKQWVMDTSARIRIERSGALDIRRLALSDGEHYFELKGRIGAELSDTAVVEFYNLTPEILEPFLAEHVLDSLDGHAMGKIKGIALLGRAKLSADVSVNDVRWNQHDYGNLGLKVVQHKTHEMLSINVDSESGPLKGIELYGGVDISGYAQDEYNWDLYAELPKTTPVQVLQPLFQGVLTLETGYLSGFLHSYSLQGEAQIEGQVRAKNLGAKVDYLGTRYYTTADFEIDNRGISSARPFRVTDESRLNYAWGSLKLQHQDYDNLRLDLRLDSARNLKVLNTTARDNDLFYGTAWADGRIRVHGPLTALDMDIDLTPRKNSELTILYETDNYNEVSGAIRFASKGEKPAEEPSETSSDYLNRVNVVVHANPDLDAQFVIDKQLGDAIRGHGKGTLRMLYDEQEQFFLYGSLELQDGEYVFSIPGINVLTKRVTLDPGGSIVWTGDPYNADIQMVGHYEKKISPVALLTGTPSASAVAPTRIVSVLKLSGSLIRPTIEFDILAPDLASSATASANEANAVIQRIRSDKDETMRQAVALLLFGNFIPPSFLSGNSLETNMLSGAGVAGNSVSTIASSVVNDLFAKYGVPTRIQVNIDDVRNASGNSNTQVFVNSEWFLSDRLRLDLNYDPTVSMLVNNLAVPFNFNLEYMTRNEDWKLKAFSRSSNLLLDQSGSGSIGNGVSGNTLGAGAIYRREFHTFRSR